nr:uncharacterized mitochondrial protein AtMg00810-like [Tanacetum cinerariifolium]
GDCALLTNFVEKFLRTVRFGNNDFAVIAGYGDVVIGSMTIKKVYYVEGLGHNLFSVGQFCDKGLEVAFQKSICFVRNEDSVDLLTDDRSSNLYTIALNEVASNSSTCLLAKASSSQSWLWHQRLSYLNFPTINNLVKNNLVQGLPKMKFEKDHLCSACEQGKIHQKHHKSKMSFTSNKPLYLLHMNLCGPMRVQKYFDSSKIMKSSTTNAETSNAEIPSHGEEVFHEVFKSFQGESSSSSLNDDVQQSPEEVILPLSNTQSIPINMVPNGDEASTSHNVFNKRLEDAYFDASFVSKQYPDHVYALDKALYGLKQAPRAWYDILSQFLIESGFQKVPTPMVEQANLKLDLVGKLVDHTDYRNMIGLLMYVTSSRPDIMFATCMCARYQANPNEHHVSAVKRIFSYFKGTINLGLWYPKDSGFDLTAYSDADHARCHLDRKSTSGSVQFLGDKLVCWSSKKQNYVPISTAESEYVAVSGCCAQVLWMRTQLMDYGFFYDKVPIYCDSKSAIAISCNPVFCLHSKDEASDVIISFIKKTQVNLQLQVQRVRTDNGTEFKNKTLAKFFDEIVQIFLWIINSGCSKHMMGNRALLTNFVKKFLGTVRFGNNDFTVIAGYGDVVIGSMTIKKVYYVEGLRHNLFSVGQFCDKGLEVAFQKSTCFVRNEDGVDLLTDDRSLNLYTIALNEVATNSSTCILAKASSSQSWSWHQRLSHLNFATINNLVKNNLV